MDYLQIIGRNEGLFLSDISNHEKKISTEIENSKFLVIGGAGSIGQAVTTELFSRNPKMLDVVDISENNLVELVRNLRSTIGYGSGLFRTFAIDVGGVEFEAFIHSQENYDYVFNLSALKHVRSEKDPYTIMRMIMVNIFNTLKSIKLLKNKRVKKYFCVSTDKAANPVNLMGATKRIMEMFLMRESYNLNISTARFANVAFSDGSLLHSFNQRFLNRQPISAPNDIRRYFITPKEAGELCLISAILGKNKDIFFPKVDNLNDALNFSDIAINFLKNKGFGVFQCKTENQAREIIIEKIKDGLWPCYFFKSDTSGEKDIEEFYTSKEKLDLKTFNNIGVIENKIDFDLNTLKSFEDKILEMRRIKSWNKIEFIKLFNDILPDFSHKETGKNLDQKM